MLPPALNSFVPIYKHGAGKCYVLPKNTVQQHNIQSSAAKHWVTLSHRRNISSFAFPLIVIENVVGVSVLNDDTHKMLRGNVLENLGIKTLI